jgi:hypothetical protein
MPRPERSSRSVVAIVRVIAASCFGANTFPPRSARKNVARPSTVEMIPRRRSQVGRSSPPGPATASSVVRRSVPSLVPRRVEAADDSARDNPIEGSPGDLLDDQPEQHEVGVGVRARGAGREPTTLLSGDPFDPEPGGAFSSHEVRGDTARVVEQLPDRDLRTGRKQSWKPVLDRFVEGWTSFTGELQHDSRDERLRRALDREAIAGTRAPLRCWRPPSRRRPSTSRGLLRRSRPRRRSRRTRVSEACAGGPNFSSLEGSAVA